MASTPEYGVEIVPAVEDIMDKFGDALPEELINALKKGSQVVTRYIKLEIRDWLSSEPASNVVRTGDLIQSFRPVITVFDAENIEAGSFSRLPYARIHNQGGTIRAKMANKLTVPMNRFAAQRSAREIPNLVRITSRAGNELLAQVLGKGKSRRIEPMYALKDSVEIPARQYLDKAADAAIDDIVAILGEHVQLAAGAAGAK